MSDRLLAVILFAVAAGGALYQYPSLTIRLAILFAAAVVLVRAWLWLCRWHPLTAMFVAGFLRALLGGRRRR